MLKYIILFLFSLTCYAEEFIHPQIEKGCVAPEYPRAALQNEEQGIVTMNFSVEPKGSVTESKVIKTSGVRSLDRAATSSIEKCKFKVRSAQEDVIIKYEFKLE